MFTSPSTECQSRLMTSKLTELIRRIKLYTLTSKLKLTQFPSSPWEKCEGKPGANGFLLHPRCRPPELSTSGGVISSKPLFAQVDSEKKKMGGPLCCHLPASEKPNSRVPSPPAPRKHRALALALEDVTLPVWHCISYLTFLGLQVPIHE